MAVEHGNKVQVEYMGTLDDGTVFDSSANHGRPLEFEVGAGNVIAGFEEAVLGMEDGQEKDVVLPPEKAYGAYNPDLIKRMPRSQFPENVELKTGLVLGISLQNGVKLPAKIVEVTGQEVVLDLNPPLAGKTLHFKIRLLQYA
ncbi:MAG: peptidylprolyl isomerase [archaeon]